ncbi:MAG: cytochrome o ubiquinol oxidase subunit III [Alphaproteobacteria bacterium]|nr:MAG: cytochrome o ubiquinol oxidase subunit III [Alphaproteobacteria bacterium]
MASTTPDPTFHLVEEDDHHGGGGSPTILGFWIYLMSDALIFAALFATFGVLSTSYAGGPTPREIFELPLVALNTAILLISSITYGFAMLAMERGRVRITQLWLLVTGLLGASFVGVELYEFGALIAEGATPQRSGFLSGFFNKRRLLCLSMFWHFLDVVWIGVFTFVYLLGMLR